MSLLGWPFLVLVVLTTVAVGAGVAVTWNRWTGPIAWPARAFGLLLVMAAGAGLAGTFLNRAYDFYGHLDDLLRTGGVSRPAAADPAPFVGLQILQPGWQTTGAAGAARGDGLLVPALLPGQRSQIFRHGLIYVPAAWFLNPRVRLPVLEMLHGYPGSPGNFRAQLDAGSVLDAEIRAHRLQPVIAVFPNTYEHGRASECVNAVEGQANETYLLDDIPSDLHATFHTATGRTIGLVGYSSGGFCAVNLALHRPDVVAAAASLGGYFVAGTDPGTKSLYGQDPSRLRQNSPVWEVAHLAPKRPPLLLVSGTQDAYSIAQDRSLARAAAHAPRLPLSVALVNGAHNFPTWAAALPPALDFLGQYLPETAAPPLRLSADPLVHRHTHTVHGRRQHTGIIVEPLTGSPAPSRATPCRRSGRATPQAGIACSPPTTVSSRPPSRPTTNRP